VGVSQGLNVTQQPANDWWTDGGRHNKNKQIPNKEWVQVIDNLLRPMQAFPQRRRTHLEHIFERTWLLWQGNWNNVEWSYSDWSKFSRNLEICWNFAEFNIIFMGSVVFLGVLVWLTYAPTLLLPIKQLVCILPAIMFKLHISDPWKFIICLPEQLEINDIASVSTSVLPYWMAGCFSWEPWYYFC